MMGELNFKESFIKAVIVRDEEKNKRSAKKYIEGLEEIKKLITISDDFDPSYTAYEGVLFQFYDHVLQDLERCINKGILPNAHFYFRSFSGINAAAFPYNGSLFIGINHGVISQTHISFKSNQYLSSLSYLEEINKIKRSDLMMQAASQFTYSHEKAHLFQFSKIPKTTWSICMDTSKKGSYNPVRQLLEYDADQFAAAETCFHIIDAWKNGNLGPIDRKNLIESLSFGLAGIYSQFMVTLDLSSEMFTSVLHRGTNMEQGDYPDLYTRLHCIIEQFILNSCEQEIVLESKELEHKTFEILSLMNEGNKNIEQFFENYFLEKDKIEANRKKMSINADNTPFLYRHFTETVDL